MKRFEDCTHIVFLAEYRSNPVVQRFINHTHAEIRECSSEDEISTTMRTLGNEGRDSKEVLLLHPFKGRLFQKCPGSRNVVCCGYHLVNTAFNCLYDCAYCFLTTYLNSYGIHLFINTDDIMKEIDQFIESSDPEKIYRIGTGEFTDSLMIDERTGLSEMMIEKFALYENIFLEIKTKSANVDHIRDIEKKGNAVLAWSLNTPHNIEHYEKGSADLDERISAAARAAAAGYRLAFHFDPIILHEGWEDGYRRVISALREKIDVSTILWISLGGVRFLPSFKEIIRGKFPDEKITLGEFVRCEDGKLRYYKKIRRRIYHLFDDEIRKMSPDIFIYMCMESPEMWHEIFCRDDYSTEKLERDFEDFLRGKIRHSIL